MWDERMKDAHRRRRCRRSPPFPSPLATCFFSSTYDQPSPLLPFISSERATRANPSSFALLGSRSTLPSSSTSSTLSTSPSQDFSTAPVPPPPSTSSSSWFGRNSSSATQQQQTDREREQAEFDRLLERERKAVDGPVTSAPAAAGGGAGENRWDQLRRAAGVGGGGGGNGGSGEKIW